MPPPPPIPAIDETKTDDPSAGHRERALGDTPRTNEPFLFTGPTEQRLKFLTDTMRRISAITDPQQLVTEYYQRMQQAFPVDAYASLSRRDLASPQYRITRSDKWGTDYNPWSDKAQKLIYDRGLLGELLYRGEPCIIDDLHEVVDSGDPAAWCFEGQRSLTAVPMFDGGEVINMSVFMRAEPNAFPHDRLPEHVWTGNLFGRATNNLVLKTQLDEAKLALEEELDAVGEIQQQLLPEHLPEYEGLKLATYYDASTQASGDYYDFFKLPGDRLGIFVGDVSGHGTPAAVIMAVTHALIHALEEPPHADPPGRVMAHLNRCLCERYTKHSGTFVTAFYGVYDPQTRTLRYANAGHLPPRIKHDNVRPRDDGNEGKVARLLDGVRSLPLGIS
ncbi:MAG: SpoIIE family protein phosphatase, partial [Planctomycetota bacterium]